MKIKVIFSKTEAEIISVLKEKLSIVNGDTMSDESIVKALFESMIDIGVTLKKLNQESNSNIKVFEVLYLEAKKIKR